KAEKTWFLNADKTQAVDEDDPKAAFLLVREGSEIEEAELEKYGLLEDGDKPKRVQKGKAKPDSTNEPKSEDQPGQTDDQSEDESSPRLRFNEDFPSYAELSAGGYASITDLRKASDEELLTVPGIGKGKLAKIRETLG